MGHPLLNVVYDAGYFDNDEQGWCSNHHRLRVEGNTLHVEQWGDRNGLEPFQTSWHAQVVEVDEANELVLLSRGSDSLVFDLRTQRLLSSWTHVTHRSSLSTPPCFETMSLFARHALVLLETLPPIVAGPTPHAEQTEDVEHGSARRLTTALRRGDTSIGGIDAYYTPSTALHGIDVSRSGLSIIASWRASAPLELELRGRLPATDLRALRSAARDGVMPTVARPSLVLCALVAEAKEVGSMHSYLDHGGGEDAWDRIRRAGVTAHALLSSLPEAIAEAGATEVVRAFADSSSSGWTALDELSISEVMRRPTGVRESYVDACVVLEVLGGEGEGSRAAATALADAALTSLPAEASAALRQALRGVREGSSGAYEALRAARDGFAAFGQGNRG